MDLVKIKVSRYLNFIYGVCLYETKELFYILNNPVDYVLDGIMVINKKYIKSIFIDKENKLKEKIISEKINNITMDNDIFVNNMEMFIEIFCKSGELVEIGLESQSYSLIGKILNVKSEDITLNLLSVNADFLREEKINLNKIRIISVKTDYLESLRLVI